ncbi:MAG: hypothetical protein JO320_22000 [Alphaproteobacteria bacterium]|nr:hypothetical protein [Alphaproteobacteria bacterium]MBV9377685.1 hypothetical protein [Alphaproteobacteria bacterium]
MKLKSSPLLAGVALFALASAANAGQPLTDGQMDGVTAGLGNNLVAVANTAAIALGNFDATTATISNTLTDQGLGASVAQSAAAATGISAITASFIVVGSNAAATGAYN